MIFIFIRDYMEYRDGCTYDDLINFVFLLSDRNILSQTILELIREWGAELLPADVLIGIVTIDRLKKEYKRSSNKGLTELWDAMIFHLQATVDVSHFDDNFPNNNLDDIVTIFTTALVGHIRNSDKSRLTRKVHNLLKMSILPPDSEVPFLRLFVTYKLK